MTFLAVDAFAPHGPLDALDGQCDVVHAGAFFHLFGLEKQVQVARRVARLLKQGTGARPMVLGRHVGAVVAGEYEHATNEGGVMFRHNVASWKEMWEEVGREMGLEFEVEADLREANVFRVVEEKGGRGDQGRGNGGTRQLWFCVTRVG